MRSKPKTAPTKKIDETKLVLKGEQTISISIEKDDLPSVGIQIKSIFGLRFGAAQGGRSLKVLFSSNSVH